MNPATHTAVHRLFAAGLLGLGIAAAAYGALHVTFGPRPVSIHVRWAPGVEDTVRQEAEQRYHLSEGELLEGRTWAYTLNDRSRTNIGALVSDAVIEDTHDIDRSALRVSPSAPRRPYPNVAQWIPRSLRSVTNLGLFIGLIGISLGLLERVAPGAAKKATAQVARHPTMQQRLSLLLVMTVMGVCFLAGRTMEERADEFIHYAQIERYVEGDYSTDSGGAMLGGFHASAMIFARLIEGSTKEDIRLFVLLISGATILLFSSLVRSFQPQASTMRTLQFVFFPLLFPFWFLIYTDVYALMWLLLALLALTRDRVHVSGILMIVSLLVRQTYIVWLAMLGLWTVTVNSAAPLRQLVTRGASFGIGAGLSVSNSLSGRHWELDQVPAVGDPTDIVQFGTGHRVAAGEGQRRVALQRRVAAHLVVVSLEVAKFSFKITGIPKQHMVETFSPRRADQALHEWVGPGHMRHGLDFVDL